MPDPEGFKLGSAWMDVKPNIDQAEWDARVSAALAEAGRGASISAGSGAGSSPLSRNLVRSLEDAKPALVAGAGDVGTQVGDRIASSTATSVEGRLRDEHGRFVAAGRDSGDQLGKGVADGIQDAAPIVEDAGERLGRQLAAKWRDRLGKDTGQQIGQGIGAGLGSGVDDGLTQDTPKIRDRAKKTGQDAGDAAGKGMSPLIVSAIAGAATIGGPLLVAGIGGAMVGATALVLKQNKVISADFEQVGKDAGNAIQLATAPLTADMHQALVQVDHDVNALQPDLKNLFAAAEPDISAVTSGLTGFAGTVIPGVSKAVSSSQVIVSDFSQSLPVLGQDIGGFFTGLVRNADLQGQALEQTIGTLGNTVRVAGSLIGSASAAASADLLALTPVINGLEGAIQAVANPATVGGVLGLFGAMKVDPAVSKGIQSVSNGLVTVAAKADGAGGLVGKAGGFAEKAASGFGKMADIVGGPWGIAIGAGIGLVSGLAAALGHADDATKAITVSATDLQSAVAQDGATAGQATSAYVAAQAQLSGLADEAKNAGVPLDLLTQAAIGNTTAMGQLETSTRHANEQSRQQQQVAEQNLSGYANLNQAMATGNDRLQNSLVITNSLTTSNRQLLNSVKAQAQQTADAIEKQAQLDQATNDLNNSTNIFNATLDSDYQKLVAKAQATSESAVASLNLGTGQSALNQALAASIDQYNMAAGAGQGYASVLQALNDMTMNLESSEAAFTIALDGVSKAAAANGHSLDINKVSGAQNIQTFTQLAQSADKAAAAVYQNEVNTKGASTAFADANAKLASEKQAFIDAADKAGFNAGKVKELADQLFHLPQDVQVNVEANTAPARQELNGLVQKINDSYGTVQIYASGSGAPGGKALGANAGGGPVTAGTLSTINEHGVETVLFGQDAYVLTHGQTTALQGRPGGMSGTKPAVNATFNYYGTQGPSSETKAQMMRDLAMAVA